MERLKPGSWLLVALRRSVVVRALKVTIVMGGILAVLDHGGAVLRGGISPARLLRIGLAFAVPYLVSTFSSVATILEEAEVDRRRF